MIGKVRRYNTDRKKLIFLRHIIRTWCYLHDVYFTIIIIIIIIISVIIINAVLFRTLMSKNVKTLGLLNSSRSFEEANCIYLQSLANKPEPSWTI
jgi:hypothetical protein